MSLGDLQLLVLAVFGLSAGIAIKAPDPKGWVAWVALITGIALFIVCLLLLFKPTV